MFGTSVGIDPSGRRLAVAAVQGGVGSPAPIVPPACFELRSGSEAGRFEEAAELLRDFTARNGLAGSEARLCIPADKVFTARIDFPVLRARDMTAALSLELERLFPVPASRLRFRWRRVGAAAGGRAGRVEIAAVPADYLDRWAEAAARAGMTLVGAVPAAWAVTAAHAAVGGGGKWPGVVAMLRDIGGAVECSIAIGGEPFHSASRACSPDEAAVEGRALVEEGMQELPGPRPADLRVAAPSGWFPPAASRQLAGGPFQVDDRFEARAAQVVSGGEEAASPWEALGAFGAAIGRRGVDLLAPEGEGPWPRIAAVATVFLAVAAVVLAIAWPSIRYYKAKAELARLDARVAALRPAVGRVADAMDAIAEIDGKIAILQAASPGSGQPIEVLRELTQRLPQGTWLTGVRLEGVKVEIDGFSPAASEIFPLLTQDGRFRKVEFASPITRQPDNLERFQIRAEFVPAAAAPPADAKAEGKAK
jgi:Tfp pilus assembly protein PilN